MRPDPDARARAGARRPSGLAGALRYLAAWVAAGAVATAAAVFALDGADADRGAAGGGLRPVGEIELEQAMRGGVCRLRRRSVPPPGGATTAVRPGVHLSPLRPAARSSALARGIVVIEYRREIGAERVAELASVQRAIPDGTIVAPSGGRAAHAVRASAYRRVLICARAGAASLDALSLFRGRYVGAGARGP